MFQSVWDYHRAVCTSNDLVHHLKAKRSKLQVALCRTDVHKETKNLDIQCFWTGCVRRKLAWYAAVHTICPETLCISVLYSFIYTCSTHGKLQFTSQFFYVTHKTPEINQ
jgi:hypothetical protein